MWMILCIVFLTISFIFYPKIFHFFLFQNNFKKIPKPKYAVFFWWIMMLIPRKDRFKWFNDLCFKFDNGIIVTWLDINPTLTIRKPQQVQKILLCNKNITKSIVYDYMRPWIGNGLITSTGETWLKHRRIITPGFNVNVLDKHLNIMYEKMIILNNIIETHVQMNPKMAINILDLIYKYALDIICETSMGINLNVQQKSENVYFKALQKFGHLLSERLIRPWLKLDIVYRYTKAGKESSNAINIMHNFTQKIIEKQIKKENKMEINEVAEKNSEYEYKRKTFLSILLDYYESTKNSLRIEEIREEVETFLFAGHDTTALAISWSLFAIGNAMEVQSKIHEELQNIFGHSNLPATTQQLNKLKYLKRVIKEVLRLYPSVPSISRKIDNNIVIDNYMIPKGTTVSIQIYQLHHDPTIWKDPEIFDPDRFLPENSTERDQFAYIPFSAGPRNCIGQKFALLEIQMTLVAILRRWHISSLLKPHELTLIHNLTLRPYNDKIELILKPIKLI